MGNSKHVSSASEASVPVSRGTRSRASSRIRGNNEAADVDNVQEKPVSRAPSRRHRKGKDKETGDVEEDTNGPPPSKRGRKSVTTAIDVDHVDAGDHKVTLGGGDAQAREPVAFPATITSGATTELNTPRSSIATTPGTSATTSGIVSGVDTPASAGEKRKRAVSGDIALDINPADVNSGEDLVGLYSTMMESMVGNVLERQNDAEQKKRVSDLFRLQRECGVDRAKYLKSVYTFLDRFVERTSKDRDEIKGLVEKQEESNTKLQAASNAGLERNEASSSGSVAGPSNGIKIEGEEKSSK